MGIFSDISSRPAVTEPDVWISRFAIFESYTASPPKVIRDFPLFRGLNIIWAKEDEGDSPDLGIYGHSAGKTTLCRLIRYVLGEPSFGSKRVVPLIRKAFPEGYVAAEIRVGGVIWAVRRPIGKGRNSYIRQNSTVEELVPEQARPVSQDEYSKAIGLDGLLNALEAKTIIHSRNDIQWEHILSWCARDQETRYQSLHEWRSPRSGANPPKFDYPKADPLFVMRSVLGLFISDELALENRIADLHDRYEQFKKAVEEKQREPRYWVASYIEKLRQNLESYYPNEGDLSARPFHTPPNQLPGLGGHALDHLADVKVNELESKSSGLERDASDVQLQIDDLGVAIRGYGNRISLLTTTIKMDSVGIRGIDEQKSKQQRSQELQKIIDSIPNGICDYGDVPFDECEYIRRQIEAIPISDGFNTQETAHERSERRKRLALNENALIFIEGQQRTLKGEQKQLRGKRDDLLRKAQQFRDGALELARLVSELDRWIAVGENPAENSELAALQNNLAQAKEEYDRLTEDLRAILQRHTEALQLLSQVFSAMVRAVLRNDKYDGSVELNDDGELQFQITNGPAMSGEAIETLSVLLSDVTAVLYSTISAKGHHPRFLLHDSPHEADLARSIYRSFIRVMAEIQAEFHTSDTIPFQYILTTTSAPPESTHDDFIMLDLHAPDDLLLRRDIREEPQETPTHVESL